MFETLAHMASNVDVKDIPGLGENIRQLRKQRGWSQTELARRASANLAHVNRIEAGRYTPSLDTAMRLAEAFEVTVDYLINGDDRSDSVVSISDKTFAARIKLLATLDEGERATIINVIDGLLAKKKLIGLANEVSSETLQPKIIQKRRRSG